MSDENVKDVEQKLIVVNYAELAVAQRKAVEELQAKVTDTPSDALTDELDLRIDKLRFYENACQGNPRVRAIKAGFAAQQSVLNRAAI